MKEASLILKIGLAILAIALIGGLLFALVDGFNNDSKSWFDEVVEFFGGDTGAGEGGTDKETEKPQGDPNCAHVFASEGTVIKAATCRDTGIMGYECTLCGFVDKDNEIPTTDDHHYDKLENLPAEGKHRYTCTTCGDTKEEDHDPKESTVASTCTIPGAQIFTCKCGYVEKKENPATGHEIVERKQITGDGDNHTAYCTKCMSVLSEKHMWSEESVVVEATCTKAGLKQKTCTGCGYVKDTVIVSLGHSYVEEVIEEATCTASGKKQVTCENIGCIYSTIVDIPKLEHEISIAMMDDYHIYHCQSCYSEIGREPHVFDKLEPVDEREHCIACSVCGAGGELSLHSLKKIGSVNKADGYVWNLYSCECGYDSEQKTLLMWA